MNENMKKAAHAAKPAVNRVPEREPNWLASTEVVSGLTDADICGQRARILLEMALEEEEVCQSSRLSALIGSALTELDLVDASVKATFELAGIKAS